MAQVDGGYSSGNWGEPAAWGCSVYYPVISNAGWGLGAWGDDVWGLGNGGLVSASDTVAYVPAVEVSVSETAIIADVVARPSEDIPVSIVESANIADASLGNIAAPVLSTVSETAAIVDDSSSETSFAIISVVNEEAVISDTTSANATFVVTVNETVNAESILSTLGIFVVTVSETGNVIDLVFPNGVFAQQINEAVNAQDSVNRRRLWELIETGTTEDWSLINTY